MGDMRGYADWARIFDIVILLVIVVRMGLFLLSYRRVMLPRRRELEGKVLAPPWEDAWGYHKGVFVVVVLLAVAFLYGLFSRLTPNPVSVAMLPALVYLGVKVHRFGVYYAKVLREFEDDGGSDDVTLN